MADFHGADVIVEIAFGSTPYDATPSWTDVTADVRSFSFTRGRQYELDRIDAGTMRVVLSNADGDYNAHNTAGTYYPHVKPMVPIRVKATYNTVTYPLWQGFVERWPVSFPAQVDSVVSVECVDLFKLLSLASPLNESFSDAVLALTPRAYWRFTDAATADSGPEGDHTLSLTGSPTTNEAGVWTLDEALLLNGTTQYATAADGASDLDITGDMTIVAWINPDSVSAFQIIVSRNENPPQYRLFVSNNSFLSWNGGGIVAGGSVTVDEWQMVAAVRSSNIVTLYIDGLVVAEGAVTTPASTAVDTEIGHDPVTDLFFDGHISEVAIYESALTTAQIAELYEIQRDDYPAERTDERLTHLLSELVAAGGTAFSQLDFEVGQTTISATVPDSDSMLEAMLTVADTEFGQLFMAADGDATFHDRHYRLVNQDTTNGTFGPGNLPYITIVPSMDDERIFNQVKVAAAAGVDPFVANDADSQEAYGRRTLEKTIYPNDQNEGYDAAHHLLALHSEPQTRIEQILIRLGGDVALFPVVLGAELGNRYTVQAALIGDDLDQDVHLEAISMSLSADKVWDVTWQLSPAGSQAFWTLGVTNLSELDETTVLAY